MAGQKTLGASVSLVSKGFRKENSARIFNDALQTFHRQAEAIDALTDKINDNFCHAIDIILRTPGHVIVCGMGKSGHISSKMAATLASTGTPSFFLHPAEACHGDLGMITQGDTVILISYSGETSEIISLIPSLRHFGVKIISLVGNPDSTLAKQSDVVLDISVDREVCPNNLAPTSSTLTTLAMADALAVALINERNFQPHEFARFHPGGSLGRRLLARVRDEMRKMDLPVVSPVDPLTHAVLTITTGRMGLTLVQDNTGLCGIITDGDLRRAMSHNTDLQHQNSGDIMTRDPVTISQDAKLVDAENLMHERKVKALIAVDDSGKVAGILDIFG